MTSIFILAILPIVCGGILLLTGRRALKAAIALPVLSLAFAWSLFMLFKPMQYVAIQLVGNYSLLFDLNPLSGTVLIFINLFGVLVCLYSKDYMQEKSAYFSYLVWLIAFSNLMALSCDFVSLIFSWGGTLSLLYALLSLGSGYSAKKALIIVGFADFSLMLGIAFYIGLTGVMQMPVAAGLPLDRPLVWASFLLMLTGALAKAGCGPFHTWIPHAADNAPIPVMAILPASLDKLMGIYLLARICLDFFILNKIAMGLLLITGSLTIIFAVMMALIQHDLRKLFSYHAISQVGYMVLGFGTGIPIGIAGGIFHMINNALYKTGLFLCGGAVGRERKTFELDQLGGLARYMPVTFASALVFSVSISGLPPFNGFASKWMLYQGTLIGLFNASGGILKFIFIFSLISAMFGSALTLASFFKFIHAVFLGQNNSLSDKRPQRASFAITAPLVVLAFLCLLLGIFPVFFLKKFIQPYLATAVYPLGSWDAMATFLLVVSGLILGVIAWALMQGPLKLRQDDAFTGAETEDCKPNFPATEFYRAIEGMPGVSRLYKVLKLKSLDLFNIVSGAANLISYVTYIFVDRLIYLLTNAAGYAVLGASWAFRKAHSGVLDFYVVWALLGLMIVIFILMAR